jgi:nicotinamidase-related amidase
MPLTQLDPAAALVVIDLQKGIVALPTAHPVREIIGRAAQLARAFRVRKLPVVLVNVTGAAPGRTDGGFRNLTGLPADWTELVPELEQAPADIVISKQRVGAFTGTALDETLRRSGVTQVFLTGVATSAGVESTLRGAYDAGYHAVAVVDAMTDRDLETHEFCVSKVFPRFSETAKTNDVLAFFA